MSRNKQKGTSFESAVRDYENSYMGARTVQRLAVGGANDIGDLGWLFSHGRPIVQECKAHGRQAVPEWLREAERERGNADALAGVVVAKRRGVGAASMGEQLVLMTLRDFMAIVTGDREE